MATQASVATAPRQNLLATHPLISFFVMAYACSWLVWMPVVLSEDGVGLLPFSPFSSSLLLERVMNLGENRIGMRIPRSAWFLRDLRFPHSYAVSNRVHNTL